jgi:glycosyltransferase involved in cell wall biosynthesis
MDRPRITHVIGSLDLGGAERVLCALLAHSDPRLVDSRVITLIDRGALRSTVREMGIAVETLALGSSIPDPSVVWRLAGRLFEHRPHVVVTWLYHSNLIGGLAAQLAGRIPVVWNVRHSTLEAHTQKRLTRCIAWCGAQASRWLPTATVYVAHKARDLHVQQGYSPLASRVIPNGFDTNDFRPDPLARSAVRRELGLPDRCRLIGLIGRFHADKDFENFARCAAQICQRRPDVHFLLCGEGVTACNSQLAGCLDSPNIAGRCHLLGPRDDMPRLMAALDLLVSSSVTEAMPNVVGEAMACEVPCLVTDVGDSALLVGPTGRVVPPRSSTALAEAALELLSLPVSVRRALGKSARERILAEYSVDRMLSAHWQLWGELAGKSLSARQVPIQSPWLRAA